METTDYNQQAINFANKYNLKLNIIGHRIGKMDWDTENERAIFQVELERNGVKYAFDFGQSLINSMKPVSILESDGPVEIYKGVQWKESGVILSHKIETTYAELRRIVSGEIAHESLINLKELEKSIEKAKLEHEENFYEKRSKKQVFGSYITPFDFQGLTTRKYRIFESFIGGLVKKISEKIEESQKDMSHYSGPLDNIKPPTLYDILAAVTKYDPEDFDNFCLNYGYDNDSRKAEKTYHAVQKEYNQLRKLFADVWLDDEFRDEFTEIG